MAFSQASFACSQLPITPSRFSRTTARSNSDNSISTSIDIEKWSAAPYQALVLSRPDSSHLPNGLNNFTDRSESLHKRRLKEARDYFGKVEKGSLESLVMVDALQRLGIAYLFEEEIRSLLQEHLICSCNGHSGSNSLYEVALRFRLLRQEGYNVPADIFEGFKSKDDYDGGFAFDQNLCKDIIGLMSMYEASHLSMEGEDILDEAATFSRRALSGSGNRFPGTVKDINGVSSPLLRELVRNSLSNPFHKSLPKFNFESSQVYHGGHYDWTTAFRELAILDSNLVAAINRDEILQVYKWWKDLGLAKELKFARDQPIKWYMWPMGMLPDPKLSQERVDITKPIAMVYIMDDIFDVRGSLEELTLFTEAINRWECMEELPDYMKTCFSALDDITNKVSYNIYKKHGWNPTDLLRKSWKSLCDAFLVEARWFTSCHYPSADEYLKNAMVSSGVNIVIVHLFAHLCECPNRQNLDMLGSISGISSSTAKILRLWDDLGSAKDENQEGYDGSYVECYMKENPSCSLKGARDCVKEMISDAWKSLNKEYLFVHPFSASTAKAALNMARMVPLMYDYDENHRLPRIDEYMKLLLLNISI